GRLRRYPLLRNDAVVTGDFLRLASDPRPERIVGFASRWGALGHGDVLFRTDGYGDGSYEIGEALNTWTDALAEFRVVYRTWQDVATVANSDIYGPGVVRAARRRLRLDRARGIALILNPLHHGAAGRRFIAWP